MATDAKERNLEADIEAYLTSPEGGYDKATDKVYTDHGWLRYGVDADQLAGFLEETQPKQWQRFVKICGVQDPRLRLAQAFGNAVESQGGIVSVLHHGFKTRGVQFRVCYFRPRSSLNAKSTELYGANRLRCIRQFHYSEGRESRNTVDMVLDLNGVPVVALELKDQLTGQTYENAIDQWRSDRDPRELLFRFDRRVVAFFAVDMSQAWLATHLDGSRTYFMPFNQGSNGPGVDGGAGNPPNPEGYETSYLWEDVLQRDRLLDVIEHYVHVERKTEGYIDVKTGEERTREKSVLIFPRYHQLDCVRRIVADIRANGTGRSYLIQHSAGSGKSNSIAWTAYQAMSLHDADDRPVFDSVVIVTDRVVLDRQLQDTVSGMDHARGAVTVISSRMTSADLLRALRDGDRLIVSTLQKYSQIYDQISGVGKRYCIIVDEAHSSQAGSHARNLKRALADTDEALREYEELEGDAEEEAEEAEEALLDEVFSHGRFSNLTFVAFTATPKDKTLELFGTPQPGGGFRPFHVYSMRQAIEEHFILNPLAHYQTYDEAVRLARTVPDNPELPTSPTLKLLRQYTELHPYAIAQKAKVIVETYRSVTSKAIGGKGRMMVVTASRLAAVRYCKAVRGYCRERGYDDMEVLVAFSGEVQDPPNVSGAPTYTEPEMNVGHDGEHVKESQTTREFRYWGSVLIVAEKYQTGYDEPLLHTMVIDKRLRDVKAVQTICRIDRICPGKEDTLVLDFVNSREDIQKAFQPYYAETDLAEPLDVDRIYALLEEIRGYGVYTDAEVREACAIEFGKDRRNAQGRLKSALTPAIRRYDALGSADERYEFRRKVRSFVKWYGFVTQLVRMFDLDMHREYTFLRYLSKFLIADRVDVTDIDDKVRMEYYKLKVYKEYAIELEDRPATIEPPAPGSKGKPDRRKDPLDVLIERINEEYAGNLSEEEQEVARSVYRRSRDNKEVADALARHDDEPMFMDRWREFFRQIMMDAYTAQNGAYDSIFTDEEKYRAIMEAVGRMLYRGEK